jgi:hypothetical protein
VVELDLSPSPPQSQHPSPAASPPRSVQAATRNNATAAAAVSAAASAAAARNSLATAQDVSADQRELEDANLLLRIMGAVAPADLQRMLTAGASASARVYACYKRVQERHGLPDLSFPAIKRAVWFNQQQRGAPEQRLCTGQEAWTLFASTLYVVEGALASPECMQDFVDAWEACLSWAVPSMMAE